MMLSPQKQAVALAVAIGMALPGTAMATNGYFSHGYGLKSKGMAGTGVAKPESSTFVNSISLDQVLARRLGSETRFPFLNFSIYDRGWGCSWNDRGAACGDC